MTEQPIDWTDETPRRLKDAALLAFPGGGMTAAGLRRESQRGRLEIERIAGKDYVTLKAIAEMREKCRVKAQPHPMAGWKAPDLRRPSLPPDVSDKDIASMALDRVRNQADRTHKAKMEERRRLRERDEPERQRERLEKRRAKARAKYREKKAALPLDDT
jgi:hypothetical protein